MNKAKKYSSEKIALEAKEASKQAVRKVNVKKQGDEIIIDPEKDIVAQGTQSN